MIVDRNTLDNVDKFMDEIEENPAVPPDTESVVWEKKYMGKSITHRLSNIGRASFDYQAQFIEPGEQSKKIARNDKQMVLDHYFSNTGREMLEMQAVIDDEEKEVEAMRKKAKSATKLIRKKIKVADMDHENKDSLAIDREWDTSNWSDEMITAGLDYLLYVFVDPKVKDSKYLKDKAMTMIDKLLVRHHSAERHLNFKLESIVSRAISRFVKDGRSLAQQDLLCILHVSKEKFKRELSSFNFAGRVMEMLNIEGRLAAILIQHRFRTFRGYRRRKKRDVNPITLTFGSDFVMDSLRESSINARTTDLIALWKNMHVHQTDEVRNTPGGFRGPSHIDKQFLIIILEIVLTLVHGNAGDLAQGNREDFLACNGSILLANFISYPKGPYAKLGIKIASEASKVAESVEPMLAAGVVAALTRYILFLRDTEKLKWLEDGRDNLPNRQDMSQEAYFKSQIPKKEFFDCLLTVSRLATHAAGAYRAGDGGYYCKTPKKPDVEALDYVEKSSHFTTSYNGTLVRHTLGNAKFTKLMTDLMLSCKHLHCMRTMMQCYYNMACGDCHGNVLFEFTADAARLMRLVLHFIEEEDKTINTLALCLFLQLCKNGDGRDTMLCSNLPQLLFPFTKARKSFTKHSYLRAILINAALLRQANWWSYNPETTPPTFSNPEHIRLSVYKDLMRTLKTPALEAADNLTISDLTVYPLIPENNDDFSRAAEVTGARDIADFLTHPGDTQFIEHLDWDQAVAGCVILEGLTTHRGTAENLFSNHVVYYLVRSLFISRWMFAGPKQADQLLMMTFNCVRSAANALTSICNSVEGNEVHEMEVVEAATRADIMDPACYFVSNLAVEQENLSPAMLVLQRDAAKAVLDFMREYSRVVIETAKNHATGDIDADTIRSLEPIGSVCISVIKNLKKVYVHEQDLMVVLLEKCCAVIEVISLSPTGAKLVSAEWHSGKALSEHLPPPLSGVGDNGIYEENYRKGLQKMSPNLFRCLSNLCQTESGQGDCLSDGFLRRAADKFYLLFPVAEEMLAKWIEECDSQVTPIDVMRKPEPPKQSDDLVYKVREMTSCLILIGQCANYTSYMFGAANDLLFIAHYDLMRRCSVIINRVGSTPWSEYMESALRCVRLLAEDNVRLIRVYEEIDIVNLMKKVLMSIGTVPESAIKMAVECLTVVANALRTEYLSLHLPLLREPLQRVTRFHPALLDEVRSASWAVMKLIVDLEKVKVFGDVEGPGRLQESDWDKLEFGTSSDSILNCKLLDILVKAGIDVKEASEMLMTKKEQEHKLYEERRARGELLPHELKGHHHHHHQSPIKTLTDKLIEGGASTYELRNDRVENERLVPLLDKTGLLESSDVMEHPEGDTRGTSLSCGPSECGSLTLGDPELQTHGTFKLAVTTEKKAAHQRLEEEMARESQEIDKSLYGSLPAITVSPTRGSPKKETAASLPISPGKPKVKMARDAKRAGTAGKQTDNKGTAAALDPTKRHRARRRGSQSGQQHGDHNHHYHQKQTEKLPMIVDISEAPEFMETRPPVDESAAYFC